MSDPEDETAEPEPALEAAPLQEILPAAPTEPSPDSEPAPAAAISEAPAPSVAQAQVNMLAVASLVLGAGYFVIEISLGLAGRAGPIVLIALPVAAVGSGYVARGQIWRNRQRGRLMASGGVALGYIGLALLAFGWALTLLTFH